MKHYPLVREPEYIERNLLSFKITEEIPVHSVVNRVDLTACRSWIVEYDRRIERKICNRDLELIYIEMKRCIMVSSDASIDRECLSSIIFWAASYRFSPLGRAAKSMNDECTG